MKAMHVRRLATLGLLSLATACGGGGGGGRTGGGGADLNEGSYTPDDFTTYASAQPPGWHPLGLDEALLTPRTELLSLFQRNPAALVGGLQQGPDEAYAALARGLVPAGDWLCAGKGNIDSDGEEEIVLVERAGNGSLLTLWRVDRVARGAGEAYSIEPLLSLDRSGQGWATNAARLELADVDGDFVDELVLVTRDAPFETGSTHASVDVYDDPASGGRSMLHVPRDAGHTSVWAQPVDLDGDSSAEILYTLEGDTTQKARLPVKVCDMASDGSPTMVVKTGWQYLIPTTGHDSSKTVVGDFDGDGYGEVMSVGYDDVGNDYHLDVALWEWNGSSFSKATSTSLTVGNAVLTLSGREWDAAPYRAPSPGDEDGAWLGVLIPENHWYQVFGLRWLPQAARWVTEQRFLGEPARGDSVRLVAGDFDADDDDELVCALASSETTQTRMRRIYVEPSLPAGDPGALTTLAELVAPGAPSPIPAPILAAADVDGDGFHVRSTGLRILRLASPIPLVLLQAPPTKDGLSQNYDDTASAYSIAHSIGQEVGVTTQVTASVSVGYEAEDLFGAFGASAKARVGAGLALSETDSTQTTFVQGFEGSYDADVVVFQGTLYECYEYEVVDGPDPDLVGAYVTIDLPVAAKTYKWTTDLYDASVEPAYRLPAELLAHTIGDPSSYPTRDELVSAMSGTAYWIDDAFLTLGQGSGTSSAAILLAEEHVEEKELSVSAELETEFKAGGVTVGASVGIEHSEAYSVSYGSETEYHGAVGDVSDVGDYFDWRYDWGLAVQVYAVKDGGGALPGTPMQVIRYWVDANGPGYVH